MADNRGEIFYDFLDQLSGTCFCLKLVESCVWFVEPWQGKGMENGIPRGEKRFGNKGKYPV